MSDQQTLVTVIVMGLCTYLPRTLPLLFVRKQIQNPYIASFLSYLPYGILTAMVFPGVLSSTSHLLSAVLGMTTALVMAYFRKGLLTVALSASATVLITELLLQG